MRSGLHHPPQPSLPSRERGLKWLSAVPPTRRKKSLPSRERGLKLGAAGQAMGDNMSLPSRERGLKSVIPHQQIGLKRRSLHGSVD